ncbi:MBL fold metallo-hydrolase [Spirillospora sp. NPDC052242]
MTRAGAAAGEVLRAVAAEVLDRPSGARIAPSPDVFVEERFEMLLDIVERFPAVRRRAAERLAASGPDDEARALAAVLLHPDGGVVRTARRWIEPGRDRAAERRERKIEDLRRRLGVANGRLEYARRDAADHARALEAAGEALAERDVRIADLRHRLENERLRRTDPRGLAAALLALIEGASEAPGDGAAPVTDDRAPAVDVVWRAPEGLVAALRAIVDPSPPPVAAVRELDLRVVPLGGDDHIGGSCLLVEAGGTRVLVDAGLRPGEPGGAPRDIGRALDGPLDAVVVTHAHTDHCGYVPALVARRPGLRVVATPQTAALMPAMWADTVKVMAGRARSRARWGDAGGAALYGRGDVAAAVRRCEELAFGASRRIGALTVELFPAGHVLGAAGVVVRAGGRRVVVTGDISGFRQETVDGYAVPESARGADLLVMESTCCTEDHDDRGMRVGELVRAVAEVHQGGGRVLIPAFALGRAQELALIMRRHLPEVPVRIDGMAAELAAEFEALDPSLRILGGGTAVAARPGELDTFRTGVVISTSGMLNGGPAVQWARRILPEPGSALFVSGYQDEESPGRALLDLADARGTFALPDHGGEVTVPVRARVATMRLSAHADRRGLLDVVDEVAPRETMLVHGVPRRQRAFAEILRVRDRATAGTGPWRP